jgi:hypothetical protein
MQSCAIHIGRRVRYGIEVRTRVALIVEVAADNLCRYLTPAIQASFAVLMPLHQRNGVALSIAIADIAVQHSVAVKSDQEAIFLEGIV